VVGNFSAYDFLTNFVPGVVFASIATVGTRFSFLHPDPIVSVGLFFFFGMVISRVGSLVVQPSLEWIGFLRSGDYKNFLIAEKRDGKVQTMLEVRNLYRSTLTALLMLAPMVALFPNPAPSFPPMALFVFVLFSATVFLFSLQKQSKYLTERIRFHSAMEKGS